MKRPAAPAAAPGFRYGPRRPCGAQAAVRSPAPRSHDPSASSGPLAGGAARGPDPLGDGTRTTLGAWDLGDLMDQLDEIRHQTARNSPASPA